VNVPSSSSSRENRRSLRVASALTLALGLAAVVGACDSGRESPYEPPPYDRLDGGADGASAATPDGDVDDVAPDGPCTATFRYVPSGSAPKTVAVTGEWNGFAKPGVTLAPDPKGGFAATVELPPGLVGYKLLVDGEYRIDPEARLRKYVGGVENSAVRVRDCKLPELTLAQKSLDRASGRATFRATVHFERGHGGRKVDAASVTAVVQKDGKDTPAQARVDGADLVVEARDLADGKYTIVVSAKDRGGRAAKPLRLMFWVEPSTYEWKDAVIYMAMVDRFKNGDPGNDPARAPGVDARADFQGGDLQGIRQKIADGTFDRLGVRALWLSPFNTNPAGAYAADDGVHQVVGYHGYWPIRAREVDARIGGAAGLKSLVAEAHAHGIRVLADFVVNHVHKEHEYFKAHPEWFRTGCVCGTNNCDWTGHRLDCLFADYLPDVNWSVTEASEQFGDDALFWLEEFDLDGLRIDAVKHVEDASVMNMATKIREELEVAGTRVFLTGETAMGWGDCGLACNANEYGTISRYIGPWQLDGQFDFVLHHAVPYRTFAYDEKGLIHADYWAQASTYSYPPGAIMTPYIGSHDTSRFVTLASYRGQDGAHGQGIPGNKWDNVAAAPPDAEPYARHRLALAWLMALPGAPLLYYGDEYGQWGGADPNNRAAWRGDSVSGEEATTLAFTQKLGAARRELAPLRRGEYRSLLATEDDLVFARQSGADVVVVALTRRPGGATLNVPVPATLPLADGTVLKDRLSSAQTTVSGAQITVTLPGRGAAYLAK